MFKILILSLLSMNLFSYEKVEDKEYLAYKVDDIYEDVLFALKSEIAADGFILSYQANIGKSTKETSKFYNKKPLFLKAHNLGFCKKSLTLKMMSENPKNIIYCPLSFAIYEIKKNEIHILYKKSKALRNGEKVFLIINQKIENLIDLALED